MKQIATYVVIGILIALACFLGYKVISANSRINVLSDQVTAYKSAKADTVILYDTIHIPAEIRIKPIPVKTIIHDTIIKEISENWYDSTFNQKGIRFHWSAHILGNLNDLSFSDFVFPKEIDRITLRTDTCFSKSPAYKAKLLHWGLYAEMVGRNFKDFPGIGIGGQIIVQDQLTVGIGGVYLNGTYVNVRIGLLFK